MISINDIVLNLNSNILQKCVFTETVELTVH